MHYHGKNFFKLSWLFLTSLIDSSDIANSANLRMLPGSISPLSISRAVYAIMRSSPARWVPICEPNNSWIFLRHYLTKWGRPISLRPLAVLKLLFCLCAVGLILKYQFSLTIASIDDELLHHKKGKVTTSTHMDWAWSVIWIWSNVDNKSLAPMDQHLLWAILSSQVKSVHLIQTIRTGSQDKDIISILSAFSLTFLYAEKFTKFLLLLLNPSKEKQAWLRHQILSIVISPLPLQILRSPDLFINQSITSELAKSLPSCKLQDWHGSSPVQSQHSWDQNELNQNWR